MKKILFSLLLLINVSILSAQSAPSNYDGGNELRAAILKAKNKKPAAKKKKSGTHTYIVQKPSTAETSYDKLHYAVKGYSSPEQVQRVTSSPDYPERLKESQRAEAEHLQKLKDEEPRRKADSIAKVEKDLKRKIMIEKLIRKNDSINKIREAERKAYLDEQREAQKKNR